MKIDYLTLPEVIEIHKDQINKYGGRDGVRDLGQIESAIFRPQSGYYTGLIEQASALWESLSQNHGFVDGNKRVAFASTYTFLAINNIEISASQKEAISFIIGLYDEGTFEFEFLNNWLKKNTIVIPNSITTD
jgi:death-on-curing protein